MKMTTIVAYYDIQKFLHTWVCIQYDDDKLKTQLRYAEIMTKIMMKSQNTLSGYAENYDVHDDEKLKTLLRYAGPEGSKVIKREAAGNVGPGKYDDDDDIDDDDDDDVDDDDDDSDDDDDEATLL